MREVKAVSLAWESREGPLKMSSRASITSRVSFIYDGDGDLPFLRLGEEVGDGFEVAGEDDASGGGVDGAPVEVGAVAAADDGLVGTLSVVLGAGGEVLGVEYVGADHDVLDEGVAAFELESVAGIEAVDEVVDGDAVEGAGFGDQAENGEDQRLQGWV